MQKGGERVQIACQIAYVINGRPLYEVRDAILLGGGGGARAKELF